MLRAMEVAELLAEACPDFAPKWAKHIAWAVDEGEKPIWGEVARDAAHVLGRLRRREATDCFPAVFAVVERGLIEGDDWGQFVADELVDCICSANGTFCDPSLFEPYLGPAAAERWRLLSRGYRDPDPGAEEVLALLVKHNPARLEGDLRLHYRWTARYLPSLLDMIDSFDKFRYAIWFVLTRYVPPHLAGPEERCDAIARELWRGPYVDG
jgi:hypothetical protein